MSLPNWEAIKREEKGTASVLDGLPKGMPALAYSQAMQRRAARVGFDWKEIEGAIDKLGEEVQELRESATHEERVREFGDMLFALVNVARWMNVESEEALQYGQPQIPPQIPAHGGDLPETGDRPGQPAPGGAGPALGTGQEGALRVRRHRGRSGAVVSREGRVVGVRGFEPPTSASRTLRAKPTALHPDTGII